MNIKIIQGHFKNIIHYARVLQTVSQRNSKRDKEGFQRTKGKYFKNMKKNTNWKGGKKTQC